MARRILNRRELRNDFDAAERTKTEDEEADDEEEEGDDDDDEEEDEPAEEGAAEEDDDAAVDEDEEEKPKKKKKKKVVVAKEKKPRARARSSKVVRMKVLWGVFNNSNVRVAVYDYPKKKEAEEHAAKLMSEKKTTFFVQPCKEPIEEKKEKEK